MLLNQQNPGQILPPIDISPQNFDTMTLYRSLSELRALASKLHWCYIYFIVGRSFGWSPPPPPAPPVGRRAVPLTQSALKSSFFYRLADSTLTFFPSLLEFFRFDVIIKFFKKSCGWLKYLWEACNCK